jgi:hypothetical protein
MKFDGAPFAAEGVEPTWFIQFLFNYNRVIKYLVESNLHKQKVGPDVAEYTATIPIQDTTDVQVFHNLGVVSSRITTMGRVECCVLRASSTTFTTINCRLISFRLTPGQSGFKSQIQFEDVRQLYVKDTLRFGTQTRVVKYVNGNLVTLESEVNCDNVTVVPLALDTVTVTVI